MSGKDMSTAETAQSDQYFPATHSHFHHYNKQQQQQLHQTASPQMPQQQHLLAQPQQQQQCVLHIPHSHQLQHQQQQPSSVWMPYKDAELDDFHWQQQQNKQHTCSNSNIANISNLGSLSGINSIGHSTTRTYITPGDIPPPPPHPPNISSSKRFQAANQRQRLRCQCDHPIEIMQAPQTQAQTPTALSSGHHANQSQQHHHQHPHRPHNYPQEHLPAREHLLTTAHSHPQKYFKNHHHLHHRNSSDPHLRQPASKTNSSQWKNLVYSQMKTRRLRIILGVIFAVVVIALLATALTFIIKSSGGKPEKYNGIKLEDILTGHLAAHPFNATWSTGSNVIYKENNNIVEYDAKADKKTILMENVDPLYASYTKSADGQFLLLGKNYIKHFRWTYDAQYDIYNISSRVPLPLKIRGEQKSVTMVQWAPVGNALIINFERNLYYKPTAFADEIAITDDTNPAILNGIPDWVYEEEVFGSNSATWFNPNGTIIAFIQFDDSPINTIYFPFYGEAGDLRYQYPVDRYLAYPKAGSWNPHVKLFTADLELAVQGLNFLTPVPLPAALNTGADHIITVVSWLDNSNLLSVWMNRIQNLAYLEVFDGRKRHPIFNMESKTGWVDLFAAPFRNRDGKRIALILPQTQEDGSVFHHLCTLATTPNATPSTPNSPEVLTKGKYTVQSILHWDAASDVIFYTANTEQSSEVSHVYAVKASTNQQPKCLSCKLHTSGDVEQNYYTADFNTDHQVVISSLGPGIPMHIVYSWSYAGNQVTLTKVRDWDINQQLREKLKGIALPTTEILTVPIPGTTFSAKVLLQLPPNIDRNSIAKYPLLVDVYGGPGADSVLNKWIMDWGTYLSSNQSVIIAKIDGRGSGLRGDKLLHAIYLKLGTVEISDQIRVTQKLQQMYPFIDSNHTGIWGWSYGGYAAAMALANDNSTVFRCAASIAPVTDWAYYDSIYTERYMSKPNLNPIGYSESRLSTRAESLRGKKFLLVHGTSDDNVHFQQAMILAKNLERNDILFKQISYPDENHGLGNVRPHLYHSLDRFFGECFASKRMMHSS